LFSLFLCLVILTILFRLKRDLYEHFLEINCQPTQVELLSELLQAIAEEQKNHRNGQ